MDSHGSFIQFASQLSSEDSTRIHYNKDVGHDATSDCSLSRWLEEVTMMNTNCNHNFEPKSYEGCGCTGSYNGGAGSGTNTCGCDMDIYQSALVNKKPSCEMDYQEYHNTRKFGFANATCCGGNEPDTYELIRNTDAQKYKGRGEDRSFYFM